MRLFIAIEITEDVRHRLAQAQASLQCLSGVKWVEPQNFHLTLRFLGETEAPTATRLLNRTAAMVADMPPFAIAFAGAGAFPDGSRPRVIWAGVSQGREPLFALAQRVEAAAQEAGFAAESRPFSAHLTLGRARGTISAAALAPHLEALKESRFGEQQVDHITFMQSTLTRSGPIYTPFDQLSLGASQSK